MTIAAPTRAGRPGRDLEPPPVPAQRDCPEVRARAIAGDAEAFGQLYDECHELVMRYIQRRCPNRQVAEDLCHETFLRALRRVGSFREQGRPFGSWLVTIARNIVTDYWKASAQQRCTPLDLTGGGYPGTDLAAALRLDEDPAMEVVDRETRRLLEAAMRDLTDAQREVLELRYFCGLSVAETAQKMGLAEGAIKALTYRAVRSLAGHRLLQQLRPAAVAA